MSLDAIGYCGLHCGGCPLHEGRIADLARDLRKELRSMKFEKAAEALSRIPFYKAFESYGSCYEVLGALVKMRCPKTCREGGGNPMCGIRKCCTARKLDGCWGCTGFETCSSLDILRPAHGIAHLDNLRTIRKKGIEAFLEGGIPWFTEK
jgi:hypothetical protein